MKTRHITQRVRMTARFVGIFAILLSPLPVFGFPGGNGSADAPYQVANAEHLDDVRNYLGSHFVQTDHIDLSDPVWSDGAGWMPIGTAATPFTGSFDGGGFTIEGLAIARPADDDVGLFGRASGESSLRGIRLTGVSVTGGNWVGALAGRVGSVADCHASGTVTGGEKVGGLVGWASGIADSSAGVAVTGTLQVGGLAGTGSGITGSMATGTVTGGDEVGGLLGAQTWSHVVTDSYATGAVSGGNRVAGLIGYNPAWDEPLRCYAAGPLTATGLSGGLGSWVMYQSRASFWDIETSGAIGSSGGKGLTTAQMGTPSIFGNAGWGGHGWVMNPGEPPRREWEGTGAPSIPDAVPVPLAGMGTEAQPYQVATAADLAALSWHVAVLDAHIAITGDLDCDGMKLYPLGDLGPFTGVLDGGDHVISNVVIEYPESDSVGLVGILRESGLVKNVHITGASISGRHHTGALVGVMYGRYNLNADGLESFIEWFPARIEGCSAAGHVTGRSSTGGLVGAVQVSEVTDSTSSVTVNGGFSVGGVAGYVVEGTLERCTSSGSVTGTERSVGGVAGTLFGADFPEMSHKRGKIEDCHSDAEVTGQDDVGGLLGEHWGDGGNGPGVIGSSAHGPVSGRDRVGGLIGTNKDAGTVVDSSSSGPVQGNDRVGGLVGRQESGGNILRCFSVGDVNGRSHLGGLVGSQHGGQIARSFARGRVISSGSNVGGLLGYNESGSQVSNCYAMGQVQGGFSGGLVGMNVASNVENSYSTGAAAGFIEVGGLVGYGVYGSTTGSYWDTNTSGHGTSSGGLPRTTEEMTYPHDSETYVGWNFAGIWNADADGTRNHGYPYLSGVTPPPAMIVVAADPPSGGNVSGGGSHAIGSMTTVAATPAAHHHFLGWEEDGVIVSTQASYPFTVTGERELTARFAIDSYPIAATAVPESLGSVAGGGVYPHGSLVTLTATPGPDGRFLHWMENDVVVGTDELYEFTADGPRVLVAHFGMQVVFGGGTGSAGDPYLVAEPLHLHNVREALGAHFRQTADIDLGDAPWNEWEPIGRPQNPWNYQQDELFSGHYDGGGFAIRNLTIHRPGQSDLGLFGMMIGGEISDVVIENANIYGDSGVATLVGGMWGGHIIRCHASGVVHSVSNGAGGLVALLDDGIIDLSSASVDVTSGGMCGGLVGNSYGIIRRSFATGAVTGSWFAGGFVGRPSSGLIEDCYATGAVTDPDDFGPIGGFAGGERWMDWPITIRNCYSTGLVTGGGWETGGFIGVWGGGWEDPEDIVAELEGCYWNTESSGFAVSAEGAPRSTAQMTHPHDPATYVGWDFDAIWVADTDGTRNSGYPYLRAPGDDPPPGDGFNLTYHAGPGGSIVGPSPQTVDYGEDGEPVAAVADWGWLFVQWSDGVTTEERQETNVTGPREVTAEFARVQYTLEYSAGEGGMIDGPTPQTVYHGEDGEPVAAVALSGWVFVQWNDGVTIATRQDTGVLSDLDVTAQFEEDQEHTSVAIFADGPEMPIARMGHQFATLPDGRVALFGGHGQGFAALSSANFWTTGQEIFTSKQMNQVRSWPIFLRLADGRYLLAGGSGNLGVPNRADSEIYDPVSDTFTPSGSMVRFRSGSGGAALADGRALIAGAWWTHNTAHTYGELFNPTSSSYAAVGPFGVARSHAIVMPMADGSGVVVGGSQPNGSFADMPVERYNPENGTISVLQTLLFPDEPGWRVGINWNQATFGQEMADGRYLWMATRSESGVTQYRLFTFDPENGSIAALPLQKRLPDSSSGWLTPHVLVDAARNRAHILVQVAQASGYPAVEVISIDAVSGAMVRSSNSYLPGYSLSGSGMQVLADGRIFVTGGSADGSNFNPVRKTFLITPPALGPATLAYHAGAGGLIVGETLQTANPGESGRSVFAEADHGAEFHQWSDGSTSNPRIDENVQADIEVTAHFRSLGGVEIDWYAGHGISPDDGQTWADLDGMGLFAKGMTLRDEFIATTDPNDPQSRFVTDAPVRVGTAMEIHFQPSSPDRRYTLWMSTDLAGWLPVPGQINVPGGNGPLVDAAPPVGNAFYRVEAALP